MIKEAVTPNYATAANILPICAALEDAVGHRKGKEIHAFVFRRTELEEEITVTNALLSFYMRIGRIREAQNLFGTMELRDLVSWNCMIAGYASNCQWEKAMETFYEFVRMKCMLDYVTLVSILPVCTQLYNLRLGKEVHGYSFRHHFLHEHTSVGNALIKLYAECGVIEYALWTFLLIHRKDVISWNTLLDVYGRNLLENQFSELLWLMFVEGIKPDDVTLLTVVLFYAALNKINYVKQTHGFSLRSGVFFGDGEPTLRNALLNAYAKCGSMDYATKLFENSYEKRNVITYNSMISGYLVNGSHDDANMLFQHMCQKDITTWNLMMHGYVVNGCPSEALNLFHELNNHNIKPDAMTVMSILPVFGQMASAHLLRQCHGHTFRACFDDTYLKAAFLDVYSKCGSLNSANKLYRSTPEKDLVMFTAMIGAYAMHGMGDEAIEVFHEMLECNVKPDHIVLTSILSACCHAGLVNEGLMLFNSIDEVHHMMPNIEQYACVVDLLARGGRIKEAFSLLNRMPITANANMWNTLLGACKTHHDMDMGLVVADRILNIESSDIGNYVVLSNLFAADARWDEVVELRRLMRTRDLQKPAGCSWIELGRSKSVFVAGDYSHPSRALIYKMLHNLDSQIKELCNSSLA